MLHHAFRDIEQDAEEFEACITSVLTDLGMVTRRTLHNFAQIRLHKIPPSRGP